MDKLFAAVIGTETIPANGTLVYTAQWKATTKGSLIATGQLESLSHRAAARVAITLP
jgi:hypothetical protein